MHLVECIPWCSGTYVNGPRILYCMYLGLQSVTLIEYIIDSNIALGFQN